MYFDYYINILILHRAIYLLCLFIYLHTHGNTTHMSQREDNTPSPVSKEDGSNKRILMNQGSSSNKPKQPPPIMEPTVNIPSVAMEITLESSAGQDGKESNNSNPNHNLPVAKMAWAPTLAC